MLQLRMPEESKSLLATERRKAKGVEDLAGSLRASRTLPEEIRQGCAGAQICASYRTFERTVDTGKTHRRLMVNH